MEMMKLLVTILIVQLFYSASISMLVYSMPADSINYINSFSEVADTISLEDTSQEVQDSIRKQTDIPIVEVGSLIFYSGNILIDLMLNFAFAIPQMIGMLINGIMMLFSVDSYLFVYVELFASVSVMIIYIVGVIQLLMGIRSGRTIT